MTDERDERDVQDSQDVTEKAEQRSGAVEKAPEPADYVDMVKAWSKAAPQTGQLQFSAMFSQSVSTDAWTPENLGAAISGVVRANDQIHEQWRWWYRNGQRRFYVDYAMLGGLVFGGIGLAAAGHSWGLYLVTAGASFYAGLRAGGGQS